MPIICFIGKLWLVKILLPGIITVCFESDKIVNHIQVTNMWLLRVLCEKARDRFMTDIGRLLWEKLWGNEEKNHYVPWKEENSKRARIVCENGRPYILSIVGSHHSFFFLSQRSVRRILHYKCSDYSHISRLYSSFPVYCSFLRCFHVITTYFPWHSAHQWIVLWYCPLK